MDEFISWEDEDFAQQVITYTEARNALAKARVARGFYPVVVPADFGSEARYGRAANSKGKGKGAGKDKDKKPAPKRRPTPKATAQPSGMSSGQASTGTPGKAGGKGRPSPICFRCGKKGHLSKTCTNAPMAKKNYVRTGPC